MIRERTNVSEAHEDGANKYKQDNTLHYKRKTLGFVGRQDSHEYPKQDGSIYKGNVHIEDGNAVEYDICDRVAGFLSSILTCIKIGSEAEAQQEQSTDHG
jgi:hypothetical protein